jgi:wyosine [tRNA(Phe)-imidazoG37] synthetase (radical SAM superfamily)
MKLNDKQIEEIADNLDSGMKCFYNLKTGEIKTIINFDNWIGADKEPWEEDINEIENNLDNYVEFEGLSTQESFRIMADFAENVDNNSLQERLVNALNKSKPFGNFKWQIDNSGDYRQEWFNFKKARYIDWVKDQINFKNPDKNE